MDFKKNLKEYYSAFVDSTVEYSGDLPYSPEEELAKIKRVANRKRNGYIAAAAVAILAVGISIVGVSNKPAPNKVVVNDTQSTPVAKAEKAVSKNTSATSDTIPVVEETIAPVKGMQVAQAEIVTPDTDTVEYTLVPRITVPPMKENSESVVTESFYAEKEEEPLYVLDDTKYYAISATMEPEIEIKENEYIPAGSAMNAGAGEGEEGGELWSEEEYFEYLGKNPLTMLELPSDMEKSASEEKFMLKDENGDFINDQRTFSYANADRTRLLNITASKSPIGDIDDEGIYINGIRVNVFDNHMLNTAVLEGDGVYLLAEAYGLSEEELMNIIYSLAEGMA